MISPGPGTAFTGASDGDQHHDLDARTSISTRLGIDAAWSTVRQIHGGEVLVTSDPGHGGEADAVVTGVEGLPVAVFTADCLGVVIQGEGAVGVAHGGWRGLVAGVLENTVAAIRAIGGDVVGAHVGPGIGSCCFEVGPEVLAEFPTSAQAATSWSRPSIDLFEAATRRLEAVDVELVRVGGCTVCGVDGFSHRADGTTERMAAIGWLA